MVGDEGGKGGTLLSRIQRCIASRTRVLHVPLALISERVWSGQQCACIFEIIDVSKRVIQPDYESLYIYGRREARHAHTTKIPNSRSPLVPSNPLPSGSSPTPPPTQILPTASSSSTAPLPTQPPYYPSKTECERDQLPRAKQETAWEMQHLPTTSECTGIT